MPGSLIGVQMDTSNVSICLTADQGKLRSMSLSGVKLSKQQARSRLGVMYAKFARLALQVISVALSFIWKITSRCCHLQACLSLHFQ